MRSNVWLAIILLACQRLGPAHRMLRSKRIPAVSVRIVGTIRRRGGAYAIWPSFSPSSKWRSRLRWAGISRRSSRCRVSIGPQKRTVQAGDGSRRALCWRRCERSIIS